VTTINRDEWLSALKDAGLHQEDDQRAVTVSEFAAMIGMKDNAARRKLVALEKLGRAKKTSKRFADSAGRSIATTAYRLLPPRKGKG
jgi:predicted ArsR family transcriptional regulator